ncbi:MAG: ABC transporter substrate-binding protein [Nannocystis sp.]|uniref:MlaC/ttg2D family ABC transporter substrate-binding protein n=1 Tax=Nannocystis sp. TaxID=1962667 RepID=UPI0024228F4D|nr:ABC transporter substrate-binding protein [Nannocystis sp.]MBK9754435.1 ABC transporter substrate-binding protein [Nannocystis sp.]
MLNSARNFITGLALSSVCLLGLARPAAAAEGAMDTFKARHGKVVELVKKRADVATLQKEVDALLDYKALAETSLGGPARYAAKCEPRCAEFEALLTRLIRENYLKRIRTDKKYELAYVGEETKPRGTHVITNVSLSRDGKPEVVEVVYVMHQVNGVWLTEDIITDGISLAKNYKFEFNKILKDKGINELIARLEAKLTELASNAAAK